MRVTTSLWVSALIRRVQAAGSMATVIHKGAAEAGAVFLIVSDLEGSNSFYGPAPQTEYGSDGGLERRFECLRDISTVSQVEQKIERERNFDPDIWVVEIEDRQGRTFIEY
jgi:hypothetical protein